MKNEELMNEKQNIETTTTPVETQYVDEFGNPIDPSLIDENGNYIGESVQYVDEFGNPIDPSLIDENGNYIGNGQQSTVDEKELAQNLNDVSEVQSTAVQAAESKELFSGMVTFDYNNVPITDIVNSIILDAINKGSSDIHFDPFEDGIKIRIRIDGQLNDYSIVPLYVKKNMITRIKIISGMNITEQRVPQDGAIRTELQNKTIDIRVSCLPTNMGEKIVLRIMDYSMSAAGLESLDFCDENLEKVNKMLSLPNGIILVTGATGSGKSTTVYTMLQKLNVEGTNLITVEDPIEMNIGGINQVQAQAEIGLDFATVLRSILRQDPDVIMIGEIRDTETARIAVRASITGHLVLSTIHTNNSLSTIERLTDMEVERYLLGSSLSGIVSQKLARRLCEKCRKLRPTNDYEKETFKKALNIDVNEIYEPVGCPECSKGYRGRIAIHEVLYITQAIRDAITKGVNKAVLRQAVYGGENPTKTMLQDGLQKVVDGKTSFEEILKLIDLDDDLGSNTQLGLNEQMEASAGYAQVPQNVQMVGAPQNITSTQPININITPEMLAGLNLGGLVNASSDDDDEEIVVKPVKHKKKKRIVEVDMDDIETEDDDDEEIEVVTKKAKKIKKVEEPEEVEEIEQLDELEEEQTTTEDEALNEVTLDKLEDNEPVEEIESLDDIEEPKEEKPKVSLVGPILETLHDKSLKSKKAINKRIEEVLEQLESILPNITDEDKLVIKEELEKVKKNKKTYTTNGNRIKNLIKDFDLDELEDNKKEEVSEEKIPTPVDVNELVDYVDDDLIETPKEDELSELLNEAESLNDIEVSDENLEDLMKDINSFDDINIDDIDELDDEDNITNKEELNQVLDNIEPENKIEIPEEKEEVDELLDDVEDLEPIDVLDETMTDFKLPTPDLEDLLNNINYDDELKDNNESDEEIDSFLNNIDYDLDEE